MLVVCLFNTRQPRVYRSVWSGDKRLHCGDLSLSLRALLQLSHLLALHRGRRNLLAKNNVTDFTGRERSNIDAITLAEVLKDKHVSK